MKNWEIAIAAFNFTTICIHIGCAFFIKRKLREIKIAKMRWKRESIQNEKRLHHIFSNNPFRSLFEPGEKKGRLTVIKNNNGDTH